ncbi:MAG: response regulator [Gemmatimonadetes bacterium]|nr:MAG: response regulator [Gemmatimonadota bacterium]
MATVLLIEDEEFNRDIIVQILNLGGYDAHTAEDGDVGIEKARSLKPDLILCDIMMPNMNGYDVFRVLREDPETAHIPIIFLTAKGGDTELDREMRENAAGYLVKPVEIDTLLEMLKEKLGE